MHAESSQVVDIRGMDLLLTLVTYVAIAEVVGEDEYDIRMLLGGESLCC